MVGSLKKVVRKRQPANADQYVQQIQQAVRKLQQLKYAAMLVVGLWLEEELKTEGQHKILEKTLFPKTAGQGGTVFWQGVLRSLALKSTKSTTNEGLGSVRNFIKDHQLDLPATKSQHNLHRALELLARELDTAFASHIVGRLPLLANKVKAYDPSLTVKVNKIVDARKESVERSKGIFLKFLNNYLFILYISQS